MIAQAKEKIVVADHSKLGVVTTHLICPTEEVDILIVDSGASPEAVAPFVAKGIDVRLV
jgi:DeoR family transcriptional regulator of aga operon